MELIKDQVVGIEAGFFVRLAGGRALLKTRYGYWDDDIEHRSYFIHFQAG